MNLKQRVPLLRWSFWRMAAASAKINKTGQIGDGREAAVVEVRTWPEARQRRRHRRPRHHRPIRCTRSRSSSTSVTRRASFSMRRCGAPTRRWRWSWEPTAATARCASRRPRPARSVYSVELAEANAVNWPVESGRTPGVADRITCVVGTIGDGGRLSTPWPTEHGFDSGALDFVFLDHDKNASTWPTCTASSTAAGFTAARSWSPTT